ncbi:MAG: hypothetical protein HYY50_03750 [Candidatus Kerfeldbacteria bacterium]|nr:hypothetical protein [Candidatus Kerfeldbacteria bacterium]
MGIPAELRAQEYTPTGGSWRINQDEVLELTLGPRVEEHRDTVGEAHWARDLYEQLKRADPSRQWDAIVSLKRLPAHYNPPLAMRMVFTQMIKDPKTRRVAMLDFTSWQKFITQTFMITRDARPKVRFCKSLKEAQDWVRTQSSDSTK